MLRMPEVMQEDDGDRVDAGFSGPRQGFAHRVLVQGLLFVPVGRDATRHFVHLLEQHLGLDDVAVEQFRPDLVADAQGVCKAFVGDQNDPITFAFQQRVGGHGGAHLDGADTLGGNASALFDTHQIPDPLNRRVPVGLRVLREQLVAEDAAIGGACHHVGECAASVDPEIPPAVCAHVRSRTSLRLRGLVRLR